MFFTHLTKSILDPIHGLIRLTKEEMKIISHPLFQRLRKIKQNTFLYYVFPSSTHSRFEHSIGVMHLASEMFKNAFYNVNTLIHKQNKYPDIQPSNQILNHVKVQNFEQLFYDLRIAALLHDIGHGPMSHLFDRFAVKKESFIKMLDEDESHSNKRFYHSLKNSLSDKGEMIEHETVSLFLSYHLLNELTGVGANFPKDRIHRILTIMDESLKLVNEDVQINGQSFDMIPFLNQIVAGAPLDCDRMDYLLRDSYFSGAKYGIYDLNRLLNSILPYTDTDKKIIRLGIKKSGIPAIENFLNARYELFVQLYFHKTNCACNCMLEIATENFTDENIVIINLSNRTSFINSYLDLNDESFLNVIYEKVDSHGKEIVIDLRNRRLWKRLIEYFPYHSSMEKEDMEQQLIEVKKKVIKEFPETDSIISHDLIAFNPLKDLTDGKTVILEKDSNENYVPMVENWIDVRPRLRALREKCIIGRIYINANSSKIGKEKFREIKRYIEKNQFH